MSKFTWTPYFQLREENEKLVDVDQLLSSQLTTQQVDLTYAQEQCSRAYENLEMLEKLIGKPTGATSEISSAEFETEIEKNKKLEEQISQFEKMVDEANELIPVLQKSVKDKDDIIDRLRTEALEKLDDEKKKAIREQQTLEEEITSMRRKMSIQEEKIYELNHLVKKREGSHVDERKSAEELKRMILKQENTLNEKRSLLEIKEEQVTTLREEIQDLSQLIEITESTKNTTQALTSHALTTATTVSENFQIKSTKTTNVEELTTKTRIIAPVPASIEQRRGGKAKPIKPARRHTEHLILATSPKPFRANEMYSVKKAQIFKFGNNG